MKNAFLAILSLGAVGLVSARPVPAGGFYPQPGFPYPGGTGCLGIPGCPGSPYPFSGGGTPIPQPKTARQMCNCNNPATKETAVEPFCEQAGGVDQYRVFDNVEPIRQHMCILSSALSDEIFTNEKCRKQFGPSYNAFCGNFLIRRWKGHKNERVGCHGGKSREDSCF